MWCTLEHDSQWHSYLSVSLSSVIALKDEIKAKVGTADLMEAVEEVLQKCEKV